MARTESNHLLQPQLVDLSSLAGIPLRDIKPVLVGEIPSEVVAQGSRSLGVKLQMPERSSALFLKIYYKTPIPRLDLLNLIANSGSKYQFTLEQTDHLREEVSPTEIYHMQLMHQVEQQAAAHVVGHQVSPDFVGPLDGLWVYQDVPIGYTIDFINGRSISMRQALEEGGEPLIAALTELALNGITIDNSLHQLNAIKTPRGRIRLFDLDYDFPSL